MRITCRLLPNKWQGLSQGVERSIYCRKAQAAHLRASLGLNQTNIGTTLTELDYTTIYRNVVLSTSSLFKKNKNESYGNTNAEI